MDMLMRAAAHVDRVHQGKGFDEATTVMRIVPEGIAVTTCALHHPLQARDSRTVTWAELSDAGTNPLVDAIDRTRTAVLGA